MDTGLTTIPEADIDKHRGIAQAMITRIVVLEEGGSSTAALAGTGRRFVPTVSTGGVRKTREVELAKTMQAMRPEDPLLSVAQHTLLFRARRGLAVALAVADVFAQGSDLEALQARNKRGAARRRGGSDLQDAAVGLGLCRRLHVRRLSRCRRSTAKASRPRTRRAGLPLRHAAGCAEGADRRARSRDGRGAGRCRPDAARAGPSPASPSTVC